MFSPLTKVGVKVRTEALSEFWPQVALYSRGNCHSLKDVFFFLAQKQQRKVYLDLWSAAVAIQL